MTKEKNSLLSTIQARFYELPSTERKVAQTVLADPDSVQYLSIGELAEKAHTSNATVTRFCRRLQLSGFYAFKIELAKSLIETGRGPRQKSAKGAIAAAREDALQAVTETAENLSEADIQLATDRIEKAQRVLCAGSGGSMLIATECASLFATVCTRFIAVADAHMQLATLATMQPGDCLLLFSYSGATKSGLALLQAAKKRGIFRILITAYTKAPLCLEADVVLRCGAQEMLFRSGSVAAKIAMLLPADALFREYCARNPEQTDRQARAIIEAISSEHL